MAIVTSANYKSFKGITVTTWDAQLAVIIPAAQALAERYCNRVFDSANYTEYHDGDRSDALVLRNGPVTALTSVKLVDSSGATPTVIYTYVASSYIIEARTNKLVLNHSEDARWASEDNGFARESARFGPFPCWPQGFQNIQVVYTGGYTVMPADLQLAMYQYIDMVLAGATQSFGNLAFESERLGLYQYKNMTDGDRAERFRNLFAPWRRIAI